MTCRSKNLLPVFTLECVSVCGRKKGLLAHIGAFVCVFLGLLIASIRPRPHKEFDIGIMFDPNHFNAPLCITFFNGVLLFSDDRRNPFLYLTTHATFTSKLKCIEFTLDTLVGQTECAHPPNFNFSYL